jgi:hypothetical protein
MEASAMSRRQSKSGSVPQRRKLTPRRKPKVLTLPDGRERTIYNDGTERLDLSPQAIEIFKRQERAFQEKFGRPMGPGDPIFFDPDADEPQPLPEGTLEREFDEYVIPNALRLFGDDYRAVVFASWVTRRMISEETRHWLTAAEEEEWTSAIDEYDEDDTPRCRLFHVLFEVVPDHFQETKVDTELRLIKEAERLGVYDLLLAYNQGRYDPRSGQVTR